MKAVVQQTLLARTSCIHYIYLIFNNIKFHRGPSTGALGKLSCPER